ncbi:hypothetical protein ATN38_01720 [Rhodococcus sp. FH8]|nr:hypothetical protein [Rhodococcus sp. FH8]
MSKCLALNPVGRITDCIRLPGGPATCGVPQEDAPLRSASLRSVEAKRSFFLPVLPILIDVLVTCVDAITAVPAT